MNQPALSIKTTSPSSYHLIYILSSLAIIGITFLAGYSGSYLPLIAAFGALAVFWMSSSAELALSLYLLTFSFARPLIDVGIEFYLDDFLFPVILLYLLVYIFLERRKLELGQFGRTMLIFWFVALALTALNVWRFDNKQILKSMFQLSRLLEYIFVYIIVHNFLQDDRATKRTLFVILAGATWVVLAGLYQWFILKWNIMLSTLSYNHAHIGVYIIVVFFIALAVLVRSDSFLVKFFLGILLFLMLYVLVHSFSRAAWMGFAFAFFLYIALKKSPILFALSLIGLIIIVSVGYTPEAISSRVALTFESRNVIGARAFDLSTLGRLYIWYGIAQMMLEPFNFLFGVGQGAFQFAIQPFVPIIPSGASGAHNNILHIFSELGIIGLVVFSMLLWRILKFGVRAYRSAPQGSTGRDYAIAHLCIFTGLSVTMVSQETFSVQEAHTSFLGFYFFCLAVLERCICFVENK